MPIYEYECLACGQSLEALQKISEDPLKECPECKQESLQKKVSAVAFRLSGSGWYETDFKTNKDQKRNLVGDSQTSTTPTTDTPAGNKSDGNSKTDAGTGAVSKPAAASTTTDSK